MAVGAAARATIGATIGQSGSRALALRPATPTTQAPAAAAPLAPAAAAAPAPVAVAPELTVGDRSDNHVLDVPVKETQPPNFTRPLAEPQLRADDTEQRSGCCAVPG